MSTQTGRGAGEVIVTPRLRLSRQTLDDAADLHRLMSIWEVVRNTGSWPHPVSLSETRDRIQTRDNGPGVFFSVRQGGVYVGCAHVMDDEIGYALVPEVWGQGLATEIVRALAAYSFDISDTADLRAQVWADNPGSARVLEKVGFAEISRGRDHCTARNADLPNVTYALMRPSPS